MKTLITLGKVAALLSSPLLLGLYVYDRSGGNVFAPVLAPAASAPESQNGPALPDPGGVPITLIAGPNNVSSFEQVSDPFRQRLQLLDGSKVTKLSAPLVLTPKSGPVNLVTVPQGATQTPPPPAKPITLFPGSKSYSGATVIDAGTLQVTQPPPAARYPTLSQSHEPTAARPATMLPGSKSIVMPSLVDAPPTANAPVSQQSASPQAAARTLLPGSKSPGPLFHAEQTMPQVKPPLRPVNSPPVANAPGSPNASHTAPKPSYPGPYRQPNAPAAQQQGASR